MKIKIKLEKIETGGFVSKVDSLGAVTYGDSKKEAKSKMIELLKKKGLYVLLTIIVALFSMNAFAQTTVDSSYFESIDGRWYEITISKDSDGNLVSEKKVRVGQTGDTSEVVQIAFTAPINEAQAWASTAGQAVSRLVYVRNLIQTYGNLWQSITGKNRVTELSTMAASAFLQDADQDGTLDPTTVRLFIFNKTQGNYALSQLVNGRMRITSESNPENFYAFVPWSMGGAFQLVNIPCNDDALVKSKLEDLKAADPSITTEADAIIAKLGSLTANPVLFFVGETVRPDGRKFPVYQNQEGTVRVVFMQQ